MDETQTEALRDHDVAALEAGITTLPGWTMNIQRYDVGGRFALVSAPTSDSPSYRAARGPTVLFVVGRDDGGIHVDACRGPMPSADYPDVEAVVDAMRRTVARIAG